MPFDRTQIQADYSLTVSSVFRKKLLTTPQYIYKTFFIEEQNSDVSVMALGRVWRLHRIYLCQSEYFRSMFNGSWREREQNFIAIEIIDPKITLDGKVLLHTASSSKSGVHTRLMANLPAIFFLQL